MEVAQDTLPELQPIFTFMNSHSNKLYQEGYFLKLNDLDARKCLPAAMATICLSAFQANSEPPEGRPNPDRNWTESFAQLVGTVLSLWDAAALDIAGGEGEIIPTFINLTDASIKMASSRHSVLQQITQLAPMTPVNEFFSFLRVS
jgi:CCR4-NOT transcriptional complex subunit CAF120